MTHHGPDLLADRGQLTASKGLAIAVCFLGSQYLAKSCKLSDQALLRFLNVFMPMFWSRVCEVNYVNL